MLEQLRIRNFKAWRDTHDIRLAPLTVFFGTNSSGKTSLTQLLLLIKQTAASPDRRRVLHLGDQDSLVDLGTFSTLIFNHDTAQPLQFEFTWSRLPQSPALKDPYHNVTFEGRSVNFEAVIKEHPTHEMSVERLTYKLNGSCPFSVGLARSEKKRNEYRFEASNFNPVRRVGRKWPLPSPIRFYGFPDEAVAYFQNAGLVADLALELEQVLSSICYVGPLREYPHPTYVWSGEVPEDVGQRGERAIHALLAAKNRELNRGPRTRYQLFEKVIARWLKQMGLIHSFQTKPIGKGRKEYEVLVKTTSQSAEVRLPDVGFGVSQILPVLVQCFYAEPNSILIYEQPEIHLHPRVQADLADVFVEALASREDGQTRDIQIIVESHSEHFLRRLQRRIAERTIERDQVALYFCEMVGGQAVIRELEVDLFGRIQDWPDGFFGDMIGDTEHQMRAMLDRKRNSNRE